MRNFSLFLDDIISRFDVPFDTHFLFSNIVYFFVKIYFLGGSGSGCDVSIALRKAGEKLFKDDKMKEGERKRASTLKQEKECFYEELYHQTGIKKRSSLRVCELYNFF